VAGGAFVGRSAVASVDPARRKAAGVATLRIMNEPYQAPRPRNRSIYLLPNLFTTAALFSGFFAIIAASQGRFEAACVAIFIAAVLDGLDGRVARMTNTQSEFGVQYDSLADLISFGMAPALVMYHWSLEAMKFDGNTLGKIGWLVAFLYAACAALRLARFNSQVDQQTDKRWFIGLPSPSAAAVMASFVWMWHDLGWSGVDMRYPALAVTIICGLAMVSRFRYPSFKSSKKKGPREDRVPFMMIFALVVAIIGVVIDPPKVLFAVFASFLVLGPLISRRIRKAAAEA
jgi:CDP-diacylglycerol---serine O-phosphatidyltransferase